MHGSFCPVDMLSEADRHVECVATLRLVDSHKVCYMDFNFYSHNGNHKDNTKKPMSDERLTVQLDSPNVSEINSIFSVHVGMYVDIDVK